MTFFKKAAKKNFTFEAVLCKMIGKIFFGGNERKYT